MVRQNWKALIEYLWGLEARTFQTECKKRLLKDDLAALLEAETGGVVIDLVELT